MEGLLRPRKQNLTDRNLGEQPVSVVNWIHYSKRAILWPYEMSMVIPRVSALQNNTSWFSAFIVLQLRHIPALR